MHYLCRDFRERYLETYDDAHSDTPPFSDLFIGEVRSPGPLYPTAASGQAVALVVTPQQRLTINPSC